MWALASALFAGGMASRVEALELSLTVGTDYVFRGVSQNDESAALALDAAKSYENGVHWGLWVSNIDFAEVDDIDDTAKISPPDWASAEADVTIGKRSSSASGIEFDYGLILYEYPGGDGRYQELYVDAQKNGFGFGFNYSPDYFNDTGRYWALRGGYDYRISQDWSFGALLRYNRFEDEGEFEAFFDPLRLQFPEQNNANPADVRDNPDNSESAYWDWEIGFSGARFGFDWTLLYVGSNLDATDSGCGDPCDDRVVLSVGFGW